jgi:hypothetical protein
LNLASCLSLGGNASSQKRGEQQLIDPLETGDSATEKSGV